jgi:hypothetical protein
MRHNDGAIDVEVQSVAVTGLAGSQEGIHNVLTPVTSRMGARRRRDGEAAAQSLVPAGAEKKGTKPYSFAGNNLPDSDKVEPHPSPMSTPNTDAVLTKR